MQKTLHRILLLLTLVSGVGFTACSLDDDNGTTTSPQCVIASFSVGDISTAYKDKTAAGNDTTYTRVIESEDIYFNIDQLNNRISSVDSLPSWVDITRVVPTVSYYGYIYCCQGEDTAFYSFHSGSDSIDFSQPVRFLVRSTDGTDARIYTAEIFKADQDADSLYWTALGADAMPALGNHRLIDSDGQLYAYADNASGSTVSIGTIATGGALSWTTPALTTGEAAPQSQTVCKFQDQFCALSADGRLLLSSDGLAWESASTKYGAEDRAFSRLLCADGIRLYATAGDTALLATTDLINWDETGATDLQYLPEAPVQSATYSTNTNTALSNVVMMGLSDQVTDHAATWYKVSAEDDEVDQDWAYIRITADNSYAMPALDGLRMTRYANKLYAIGNPYTHFYRSDDNGITWHKQTAGALPPTDLQGDTTAQACLVASGGYLWLTTGDGRVWRGLMR